MARRGSPARRKSTTSAWLLLLGFPLLRHVVICRKARGSHAAVSQRHRLLWARSSYRCCVYGSGSSFLYRHCASVRPEGGRTQDLTFDLPVSSQMPLSRSSFSPSAVTSCWRVRVWCPLLTSLPSPSPSRSPTPSPSPSLLLGIGRPSTRTLVCISVYQNPTLRRISGAQCKERDLPGASLFRTFTAAQWDISDRPAGVS